jgi:hypothetical protein
VHGSLEEGWGIGKAEIHDAWDVGALWGFKRCFMLVFFRDADIVIAPADIEL